MRNGQLVNAVKTVTTYSGQMTCNSDDAGQGATYQTVEIMARNVISSDYLSGPCDLTTVYSSRYGKDAAGKVQDHRVTKYSAY